MAKSITRIDVKKPDLLQRKRVAAYARVSMDTERLMHVYVVKDDGEGELTSLSEEEIEQFSAMFYEPDEDIEFSLESCTAWWITPRSTAPMTFALPSRTVRNFRHKPIDTETPHHWI